MNTNEAKQILGITGDFDEEDLKAAYRAAIKKAHPDVSSLPRDMSEMLTRDINEAKDLLAYELEHQTVEYRQSFDEAKERAKQQAAQAAAQASKPTTEARTQTAERINVQNKRFSRWVSRVPFDFILLIIVGLIGLAFVSLSQDGTAIPQPVSAVLIFIVLPLLFLNMMFGGLCWRIIRRHCDGTENDLYAPGQKRPIVSLVIAVVILAFIFAAPTLLKMLALS